MSSWDTLGGENGVSSGHGEGASATAFAGAVLGREAFVDAPSAAGRGRALQVSASAAEERLRALPNDGSDGYDTPYVISSPIFTGRPDSLSVSGHVIVSSVQAPPYSGGPYDYETAIILNMGGGAHLVDSVLAGFRGTLSGVYTSNITFEKSSLTVSGGEIHDCAINDISQITLKEGAIGQGLTAVSRGAIVLSSGSVGQDITLGNGGTIYITSGATVSGIACRSGSYIGLDAGAKLSSVSLRAGASFFTYHRLGEAITPVIRDLTNDLVHAQKGNWTALRGADGLTYFQSGAVTTRDISAFSGTGLDSLYIASGAVVSGIVASQFSVVVQSGGSLISSYIQSPGSWFTVIVESGGTSTGNVFLDTNVRLDAGGVSIDDSFYGVTTDPVEIANTASVTRPNIGSGADFHVLSGGLITDPSMQDGGKLRIDSLAEDMCFDWIDACFLAGTQLLTPSGECPVEMLDVGDRLICLEQGEKVTRPITRMVRYEAYTRPYLPDDLSGYPVRIVRGAFGAGLPYEDLLVTAEHCFLLEGRFVPVRMLVNGGSIFYDRGIKSYDYYHVELDRHAIILAHGVETESYLDTGHGQMNCMRRSGGQKATCKTWVQDAAAPLETSVGFVHPLYQRLRMHAASMGLVPDSKTSATTSDPALALTDDHGRHLDVVRQSRVEAVFRVPAGTGRVWLTSRASRPCDAIGPYVDDRRTLGVLVGEVHQSRGAQNHALDAHLDVAELEGWSSYENPRCRWTTGRALIGLAPSGMQEDTLLSVEIVAAGPYRLHEEERMRIVA